MLRSPPLKIGRRTLYLPISVEAGAKLAAELFSPRVNQRNLAAILREDLGLLLWAAFVANEADEKCKSIAALAKELPELLRDASGWKWSAANLERKKSAAWQALRRKAKKLTANENLPALLQLLKTSAEKLAETKTELKHASTKVDATSTALAKLLCLSPPFAPSPLRPLAPSSLEAAKQCALYNFAYGLSHEINNPLANISLRAQSLQADERDPEKCRKLGVIHTQAMRAHEMIADLMLYAHPPQPNFAQHDIATLIASAVDDMQDLAAAQGTTIAVALSKTKSITADAAQIRTVLRSLIQNSLEALQSGGNITISGHVTRQYLELTITDTGPGIPATALPHIFDPFYSGREAGRGLGLGLSKCWRIIELHGGSIEVNAKVAQGAEFQIQLPLMQVTRKKR